MNLPTFQSSETLVSSYQFTRSCNTEDRHLHSHRLENGKTKHIFSHKGKNSKWWRLRTQYFSSPHLYKLALWFYLISYCTLYQFVPLVFNTAHHFWKHRKATLNQILVITIKTLLSTHMFCKCCLEPYSECPVNYFENLCLGFQVK
jgi:hypothetical protein